MQTHEAAQFAIWMTALGELYGKAITAPISEMYWQALTPYAFEAVDQALQAHIGNPDGGQFMPRPADIIRYIIVTAETRALLAWTKVTAAIRRVGAYDSVVFDDPCIHSALVSMGGWVALCRTNTHDMPFRAREFQAHYTHCVEARETGETPCPPVLHGILPSAHSSPYLLGTRATTSAVANPLEKQKNKGLKNASHALSRPHAASPNKPAFNSHGENDV